MRQFKPKLVGKVRQVMSPFRFFVPGFYPDGLQELLNRFMTMEQADADQAMFKR